MQHSKAKHIATATYLNTLLDFTQPGKLKTFINAEQLNLLNYTLNNYGYLDGKLLDFSFNMLRPHELIWSAFIKQYLLKQKTDCLDFLFWNADSTNLPKKMFSF